MRHDATPTEDAPPALALRAIEVRYGRRPVLTIPELTVGAGEVLAVMGANGAGKSTLLHVAALLRQPDAGEVWIVGERATRRTRRALRLRIAVVFQVPLLFDLNVLQNAAAGLRFRGVRGREAERRAGLWLARFGVEHLATRHAKGLSGGEAQRVGLARAFAVEPELLLLHEPFAALDVPTRTALIPELAVILRETRTAGLMVTHTFTEAVTVGDRLAVLLEGHIAQLGFPRDVAAHPAADAVAALVGAPREASVVRS